MFIRKRMYVSAVLFAAILGYRSASGSKYDPSSSQASVVKQAAAVRRARSPRMQIAAAEKLRNTVYGIDEKTVDDSTIHIVADLLNTNNDGVRYWVADALSRFGERARFSGPRLLEILRQQDCVMAETTSIFMIRKTLNAIGVTPPPRNCDHYSFPK